MKRRESCLVFAAAIFSASLSVIEPTSAASPDCGASVRKSNGTAWKCTFADEFSGSKLDSSKWVAQQTAIGGNSGDEIDCWVNSPNNISVSGGTLRLTTRKESEQVTCNSPHGAYKTYYTSGSVSTWGKFQQTFGRWQIRAKFPDTKMTGSQSALWLYPRDQAYGDWPRSGEIDIAEYYTRVYDRVYPVIHYNVKGSARRTTKTKTCMVADPWNFHTYTAEWTSTSIKIWADSTLCIDHTITPRYPLTGSQPFDKPFVTYLTQTAGVGQNRFRTIGRNATPVPLRTEVDWVHVWS